MHYIFAFTKTPYNNMEHPVSFFSEHFLVHFYDDGLTPELYAQPCCYWIHKCGPLCWLADSTNHKLFNNYIRAVLANITLNRIHSNVPNVKVLIITTQCKFIKYVFEEIPFNVN